MKFVEVSIPEKCAYIIPIGDLHIGDRHFEGEARKKLIGYLDWVRANPNSRVFLNGDIFNVATRGDKTNPYESRPLSEELTEAYELFGPVRKQIIGAIDGNHEARTYNYMGWTPTESLCAKLDIPFLGWSAIVRIKVNKRKDRGASSGAFREDYYGYFHHTTGGGGKLGSKLNRVIELRNIVEGMDFYVGSHNHQLITAPQEVFYATQHGINKRQMWYVDAGSYLGWDGSYAEQKMLPPTKIGSPRIRLDGWEHDIHVNL